MKRQFYNAKVDSEFEKVVESKDKEDMEEFNHYCHMYNHLGELGYQDENATEYDKTATFFRRMLHVLFLLTVPMNIPFSWVFPLLSSLSYVVFKQPAKNNRAPNMVQAIFSEECTNIGLIVMLVFSGKLMRLVILFAVCIWSLMHATDLARHRLSYAPDTPGLASLKDFFDQVAYSKVELLSIKANIEWIIAFLALPACFVR